MQAYFDSERDFDNSWTDNFNPQYLRNLMPDRELEMQRLVKHWERRCFRQAIDASRKNAPDSSIRVSAHTEGFNMYDAEEVTERLKQALVARNFEVWQTEDAPDVIRYRWAPSESAAVAEE